MRKAVVRGVVILAVVVSLVAVCCLPAFRLFILGVLRNEPFHDGKPASYWVQQLSTESRLQAIDALAALGDAGLPAVDRALESEDPWVRLAGVRVLDRRGQPALDRLQRAVRDPDAGVRKAGVETMARVHGSGDSRPQALDALGKVLMDSDDEVRTAAIKAVEKLDTQGGAARTKVARLTEATWAKVRAGAGHEASVGEVLEILGKPDITNSFRRPNPFAGLGESLGEEVVVSHVWIGDDIRITVRYAGGKVAATSRYRMDRQRPQLALLAAGKRRPGAPARKPEFAEFERVRRVAQRLDPQDVTQWPPPDRATAPVEDRILADPDLVGDLDYITVNLESGTRTAYFFSAKPTLTLEQVRQRYGPEAEGIARVTRDGSVVRVTYGQLRILFDPAEGPQAVAVYFAPTIFSPSD